MNVSTARKIDNLSFSFCFLLLATISIFSTYDFIKSKTVGNILQVTNRNTIVNVYIKKVLSSDRDKALHALFKGHSEFKTDHKNVKKILIAGINSQIPLIRRSAVALIYFQYKKDLVELFEMASINEISFLNLNPEKSSKINLSQNVFYLSRQGKKAKKVLERLSLMIKDKKYKQLISKYL